MLVLAPEVDQVIVHFHAFGKGDLARRRVQEHLAGKAVRRQAAAEVYHVPVRIRRVGGELELEVLQVARSSKVLRADRPGTGAVDHQGGRVVARLGVGARRV
jgi:hypothetical protein